MEEALLVFERAYRYSQSAETGIVELKRNGFSQIDTIIVLMQSLEVTVLEANQLVINSAVWSN